MGETVGVVPLEGRGDLPLVDLHGEPVFVHAVRALADADGIDRVVVTTSAAHLATVRRMVLRTRAHVEVAEGPGWWPGAAAHARIVIADPLCPLLPPGFVTQLLAEGPAAGAQARDPPGTDKGKTVVEQQIVGTIDRDALAIVASPVVLPGHLVAGDTPPVHDFALLAAWLRKRGGLELRKAPSMARRVGDESALRVLECLDELGRRVHEA